MNLKLKLSFGIYILNALAMLGIGLVYEFSSEFMPFHSSVIQTKWENLELSYQTLYLGMMRTEAAGFLATGTAIMILLFIPFMKFEQWSYWAITSIALVEYLPTIFATYHVSTVTSASPPWLAMSTLAFSSILALTLAVLGTNKKSSQSA